MTTKWLDTKAGFHRKIRTWSFVIVLTEIGGSNVKAIRLDDQMSMDTARKTALQDNPGWRFKGMFVLSERDFERGTK